MQLAPAPEGESLVGHVPQQGMAELHPSLAVRLEELAQPVLGAGIQGNRLLGQDLIQQLYGETPPEDARQAKQPAGPCL